jgi:hypothetical protein
MRDDPVLVAGLRDERRLLLRAHGLFDFTVACVIAAVGGATQAGALVHGSCVPAAGVIFGCAAALTAYCAVVRPFKARLEVAVSTAQAGALALLCGLTLGAVATGTNQQSPIFSLEAVSAAGTLAEAFALVAPALLLIPVLHERFARPTSPQQCRGDVADGAVAGTAVVISGPAALPAVKGSSSNSRPLLQAPELKHAPLANPLASAC